VSLDSTSPRPLPISGEDSIFRDGNRNSRSLELRKLASRKRIGKRVLSRLQTKNPWQTQAPSYLVATTAVPTRKERLTRVIVPAGASECPFLLGRSFALRRSEQIFTPPVADPDIEPKWRWWKNSTSTRFRSCPSPEPSPLVTYIFPPSCFYIKNQKASDSRPGPVPSSTTPNDLLLSL